MRRAVSQILAGVLLIALTLASSVVVSITTISHMRLLANTRTISLVALGEPVVGIRGSNVTSDLYLVVTIRFMNLGGSTINMTNIRAYFLITGTRGVVIHVCNSTDTVLVNPRSVAHVTIHCTTPLNITAIRSIFGGVLTVDGIARNTRFLALLFGVTVSNPGSGDTGDSGIPDVCLYDPNNPWQPIICQT